MKVKKLPSGNYRVQVVAGYDANGKRIVKSFTAATEWEVLRMAEHFKQNREETTGNNITVAKAMEMYIDSRKNVLEETTIRNYTQISQNCFHSIMETKLSSLRTIDIQNAVSIDSGTKSPKYVKNAYGFLKSVLKMFDVDINLSSVKLPKLIKQEKELPTFETVFNIVRGTAIELPCLLSAWLSLREGEVIGLQFRDVDTKNHTIKVRQTIVQTLNGNKVREGCKTEKSTRNLNIPDYLFNMIMAIPHDEETDFIVTLTAKALYHRFKRLMEKNGYDDITFHDLRHLNASVMLMLGIPDKYAMERGGWSTDNILKSVYQQTFTDERKRVDEKIDGYFNKIIQQSQST